jgi:4-amino-4-deoxy-L-arabinose transferase-like glycosyltransferase
VSTAVLEPLAQSPHQPAGDTPSHGRWQLWRSPAGQPPWARPALLAIAALAALLYAWNITDAGLAPFYSVAVKSMSESWKAFFYGAFDPQATITIDKLAGSFLPQALSARLFGFHPWSLALPQVIEGVISVLVMYRVVRRWAGVTSGLLAALLFTLTPIAASMFGHSMEDGALTLCLVLAADACQRAVLEGRLRSLLWAAAWIGIGFQAKMLQAWIAVPALVIAYLLCAPTRLQKRLWHLAVFAAVTTAVSLSWILLYTLTPAGDRPYIDGSTDNNPFVMVFGYNGLARFGINVPGAVRFGGRPGGPGTGAASGFGTGWTKLLGSTYGPEIAWLYPLAVLALICGLLWTRRTRRDDPVRSGFIMWGLWLLTFTLVFSKMSVIPHTAYVASLAPTLAALSGAGIVMFWRAYHATGPRGWLLPAATAASLAWAAFLWRSYTGFLPWALYGTIAIGVVGLVIMAAARSWQPLPTTTTTPTRLLTAGLALGVFAAVFAAPATWAASVLDTKYGGSSFNASAGPAGGGGGFGASVGGNFGPGGLLGTTDSLTASESDLYNYLTAHRDGASYLMAVNTWTEAAPYILATGQEVMPMGGFSGTVPSPTLPRVQQLVSSGQLKFFLLNGSAGNTTMAAVEVWVENSCATVPAKDYAGTTGANTGETLYECHA